MQERREEHSRRRAKHNFKGSEIEVLMEESSEMERGSLDDKEKQILELEKVMKNMEKEKERLERQWRESEAREAQMREEMEAVVKERDEMRRTFQADQVVLQLEEEKGQIVEIIQEGLIKHCDALEQTILEKEEMLDKMTVELDDLKKSMEELQEYICVLDPEMVKGLKEVNKQLKNFGPRWFQKLQKKTSIKTRWYLEKKIKKLELQLTESKAREARSTELIHVLMTERIKIRRQLMAGIMNIFQRCGHNWENNQPYMRLQLHLRASMDREALAAEVIKAMTKERDEMMNTLCVKHDLMETNLEKALKKMEEEINQERFKLLKRERKAIEENMVKKMNEQWRAFQAEKERLEEIIQEKDKMLEMK